MWFPKYIGIGIKNKLMDEMKTAEVRFEEVKFENLADHEHFRTKVSYPGSW